MPPTESIVESDIHGRIEIRYEWDAYEHWHGVIDVGAMIGQPSEMIAVLFGQCNTLGWEPIAEGRSFPRDVSRECIDDRVRHKHAYGDTWIDWSTIRDIDPDLTSRELSPWIRVYRPEGGGVYRFLESFTGAAYLSRTDYEQLALGQDVQREGKVHRRVPLRYRDLHITDWDLLIKLMAILAVAHGDQNVRMVVWFTPAEPATQGEPFKP